MTYFQNKRLLIGIMWVFVLCSRKISFSLKCGQNKQDKIVVGGSNGLDSNNMEVSSSICGHSEKSGECDRFLLRTSTQKMEIEKKNCQQDLNKVSFVALHQSDFLPVETMSTQQLFRFDQQMKATLL